MKLIFRGMVICFLLWESMSANAQTDHEKYMGICKDYTNNMAKALTSNRDIAAKKKVAPSYSASATRRSEAKAGDQMDQTLAGVDDYMIQSLTAASKLTERELATLGFAYCVQRKPF